VKTPPQVAGDEALRYDKRSMVVADSDVDLMLRVKRGDKEAFRVLVERHQRSVINTIYRAISDSYESEDLAQRVFVQVYRASKRYNPTAKFTTWLFTIVHNTILNEYRRRSRHAAESLEALTQPSGPDEVGMSFADTTAPDPGDEVAVRELKARIRVAVEKLPTQQRMAVILCRYEGQSYEEIAKVLKCSVAAVKSLLHRARVALKEELRGLY
jgi:RNA polymerase sigma-70 factor (ECF subfamily)